MTANEVRQMVYRIVLSQLVTIAVKETYDWYKKKRDGTDTSARGGNYI